MRFEAAKMRASSFGEAHMIAMFRTGGFGSVSLGAGTDSMSSALTYQGTVRFFNSKSISAIFAKV